MTTLTAQPLWLAEFPNYSRGAMPVIPAGFVDRSHGIEQCPCFWEAECALWLYVDFPDAAAREFPDSKRFTLWHDGESVGDGGKVVLAHSDDFNDALFALNASVNVTNGEGEHFNSLVFFFVTNADGIDEDERGQIVSALLQGDTYIGGGGAAPEFTVSLDDASEDSTWRALRTARGYDVTHPLPEGRA